jgi:hypothetical protein
LYSFRNDELSVETSLQYEALSDRQNCTCSVTRQGHVAAHLGPQVILAVDHVGDVVLGPVRPEPYLHARSGEPHQRPWAARFVAAHDEEFIDVHPCCVDPQHASAIQKLRVVNHRAVASAVHQRERNATQEQEDTGVIPTG